MLSQTEARQITNTFELLNPKGLLFPIINITSHSGHCPFSVLDIFGKGIMLWCQPCVSLRMMTGWQRVMTMSQWLAISSVSLIRPHPHTREIIAMQIIDGLLKGNKYFNILTDEMKKVKWSSSRWAKQRDENFSYMS